MKDESSFFVVLAICVLVVVLVAIRQNIFHDISDMSRSAAVAGHNFDYQLMPDRHNSLGLTNAELGLRQVYPDFFNKFDRANWQDFWDIVYGTHPLIGFKNEKIPSAERNFSVDEVQQALVRRYPELFSRFSSENWKIFWKQVFNISPGIQALFEEGKQKDRSDARLEKMINQDNKKISNTVHQVRETIGQ